MAVEEAVVSFVIERLGDLLINEAKFLYGVRSQVENAKIKLQCMRAFLKDADASVRNGDERVRLLVVQIRENSYALEDVIETYVFKVALKRSNGGALSVLKRSSCFPKELTDVHRVGSKIEEISSNIDTWTSELQKYGVKESMDKAAEPCSSRVQEQRQLRRAYSHFEKNIDVVGLDEDIKVLVSLLTVNEENNTPHRHRVISLCGMGGLGKTTLARKVYHHPQVRSYFDCFAWASISQQCNTRDVLERISFALNPPTKEKREEIKITSEDELAKELYNFQRQKKCLVVLDDIWTTTTWDLLRHAFPQSDTHSKIILTTRIQSTATHVDRCCYIHRPTCLDENQSWELFQKKCLGVCFSGSKDYEKKEEIGRELIKHCCGLPLAIIVLGGLVSTKHTIDEWEAMKKNVMTYIGKGGAHEDSKYQGVSWVLGLSYDELPFYLKPCFLYLAHYAEDVTIHVKQLCLTLIAEGLVSLRGSSMETIEDVAHNYLCELVERSMIQVEKWGSTKRLNSFRIHDLMRDLCVSKAKEENFMHFVDLRNRMEVPIKVVSANVRRVSAYFDDDRVDDDPFIDDSNCSLRCFIADLGRDAYRKQLVPAFNHFLVLRVLKLDFSFRKLNDHKLHIVELPKKIGNLIHLRLLSIRGVTIEKIPSSIGNLKCLQTLKLNECSILHDKLPDGLWKLEQLRHLFLPALESSQLLRISKLRNLQTLAEVQSDHLVRNDFLQLKNLKKLKINDRYQCNDEYNLLRIFQDPQTFTFNSLRHLQVDSSLFEPDIVPMIVSCPQIHKLRLNLSIEKLPEYSQFSPNLVKLELMFSGLRYDPMPTLEKLSSLRVLRFGYESIRWKEMVCSEGGFPRLESLELNTLTWLEEWKVEEGALSSLSFLRIHQCYFLRRVPNGLRYITTLKEMRIERMFREFKRRIKEGGEDFDIVKHVPSLVLINCD